MLDVTIHDAFYESVPIVCAIVTDTTSDFRLEYYAWSRDFKSDGIEYSFVGSRDLVAPSLELVRSYVA